MSAGPGPHLSPSLICTVRGCGRPLARAGAALVCERGHAYDVARSGYVNLLQPQDRKSRQPGDSADAVRARKRLHDAAVEAWLVEELDDAIGSAVPPAAGRRRRLLDVGCGDGYFAGELAPRLAVDACGLDISKPAIELAARTYRDSTWVIANADRLLPWTDGSFEAVLSVTSRRNAAETRRVLSSAGRALFVLPAEDDLAELREAVLGRAAMRDRVGALVSALAGSLSLLSRRTVRRTVALTAAQLADVLAATYRGGRAARRRRAAELTSLNVTMSRELLVFERA